MSVARQLYQLQELDLEIESNERALEQVPISEMLARQDVGLLMLGAEDGPSCNTN